MVKPKTTNDYLKANLEIYGSFLDGYTRELELGGKSPSAVRSIRSKIRQFLIRCPPTQPKQITSDLMIAVREEMEKNGINTPSIQGAMIHMGRFLGFITGTNPYNEIDPIKEDWFLGHMGSFLFDDELDDFITHLKGTGISDIRKKREHVIICCRILAKEMDVSYIEQIDYGCLKHIGDLTSSLTEAIRKKILFDLSEFVEYHTGNSPLKNCKEILVNRIFTTNQSKEFLNLIGIYKMDLIERGLRPKSVQSTIYSIKEGYRILIENCGEIHPKNINYHHIRWIRNNFSGLKQQTIRTYLNRLGKMLQFFYGTNPYLQANLIWSHEQVERDWIFKSQWSELWGNADVTERLVLALGGGMGLRRSEIAGLKISDISDGVMTIRGKGSGTDGKLVKMRVPPTVMKSIENYLKIRESIVDSSNDISDGNLLVMCNKRKGAPSSTRFVEVVLQQLSNRVGIHVTPHMLRRYYCTSLVDAGVDMDTIRRMMRHEHITTTFDCYVYPDPRKISKATDVIEDAIFGQ